MNADPAANTDTDTPADTSTGADSMATDAGGSHYALDGNAAAGDFATVFAGDPTSVRVRCGTCGASQAFGQLSAHLGGPGTVLRCRTCQSMTARIASTTKGIWLDLSGSSSWLFPATTEGV
jgi:hypothetical protein